MTAECSTAAAPPARAPGSSATARATSGRTRRARCGPPRPARSASRRCVGAGDHWALLAESGLGAGQPAARLRILRGAPGVLRVERPVQRDATPWRVAVVGSPATIAGSDLVDDLAAPAAGVDWSWVRPGRVAWSWWADSGSTARLAAQEAHVDFAARQGWEYVLADEGWDPAWMPALVEYARARGVGVLLWSRWDALRTAAQRDALFAQWADWGVAGVKLDFMESDSPARMAWYRGVARAAAERRMVVDFHGATAPRGLERTWPNVLTSEAVRGAEGYKGATPPTPAQNTRPPVHPQRDRRDGLHAGDVLGPGPDHERGPRAGALGRVRVRAAALRRQPRRLRGAAARRRLAAPTSPPRGTTPGWSRGRPGSAATLARRSGDRWYVGSIHAGAAGTQAVPLSFLDPGRGYVAEIVADAAGDGLASSSQAVTAASTLNVPYARDGGFVVRIRPA